MTQLTERDARAAETGANATKVFQGKKKAGAGAPPERVSAVVSDLLAAIGEVIGKHEVSYSEYDALKAWLIRVGQDGEWPLFLDVFVEHHVEASVNCARPGSKGTIEGPFYIPGAAPVEAETTLPMRADEPGADLTFCAQVRSADGSALPGALVEIWHADDLGYYSQFAPGLPEWNLRGAVIADADGQIVVHTKQPAPYRIPGDGATGALISAAGWHTWRPAHLHLKVSAPGHELLTTQLYFTGGDYLDSDIASAVKPELILAPVDGKVRYDFVLAPVA